MRTALAGLGIAAALLAGCAPATPAASAVRVELPGRPLLLDCPVVPVVEGHVVQMAEGLGVQIPLAQAEELRSWMHAAPVCWKSRELLLEGYVKKLEGRLGALTAPP